MMDDLISRRSAIDAINALHDKPNAWLDCAVDAVMALPSARPERKKGKWIIPNDCVALYLDEWICSNCTHLISHMHNFCPNCGADMR